MYTFERFALYPKVQFSLEASCFHWDLIAPEEKLENADWWYHRYRQTVLDVITP